MKRVLTILALVLLVCLTTFMGGCGDRGKIGNGENGTIVDNSKPNTNSTENSTQSTETTTNNDTLNGTENTTDKTMNDALFGNDTDPNANGENNNNNDNNVNNNNQSTEDTSQQGVAGEIGDAIDNGISNITEDIMGTDANNR